MILIDGPNVGRNGTEQIRQEGNIMASEAEQAIKRIQSHKGVKRVFVINARGQTIRSSLNDAEEERRYAGLISELTKKTQSMVRELDPENSLKFLRVRTMNEEIMIAPEPNEGKYTLIVVQDPSENDAQN